MSIKELRQFGLVLAGGVAVVSYGVLPWVFGIGLALWPGLLVLVLLLLTWIYPRCLQYIYAPWMKLAHFLGRVNSIILLSLVFFLMITPMGILARLAALVFRRQADTNSSYRKPSTPRDSAHLEKPY